MVKTTANPDAVRDTHTLCPLFQAYGAYDYSAWYAAHAAYHTGGGADGTGGADGSGGDGAASASEWEAMTPEQQQRYYAQVAELQADDVERQRRSPLHPRR